MRIFYIFNIMLGLFKKKDSPSKLEASTYKDFNTKYNINTYECDRNKLYSNLFPNNFDVAGKNMSEKNYSVIIDSLQKFNNVVGNLNNGEYRCEKYNEIYAQLFPNNKDVKSWNQQKGGKSFVKNLKNRQKSQIKTMKTKYTKRRRSSSRRKK